VNSNSKGYGQPVLRNYLSSAYMTLGWQWAGW